jgi:hypothetical protein
MSVGQITTAIPTSLPATNAKRLRKGALASALRTEAPDLICPLICYLQLYWDLVNRMPQPNDACDRVLFAIFSHLLANAGGTRLYD